MTTQATIDRFLAQKRLALLGASRRGRKFGNTVFAALTAKGYDVALVHPEAAAIGGVPCSRSLAELPEPVGGVVLVLPPARTEAALREAAALGIRQVWMQRGADSPAAVQFCRDHDLDAVHGECILMFADPAGVHRLHRWLQGLFGKLPA